MSAEVLAAIADRVPEPAGEDCVLLAVDGVDGAGKTTFADALGEEFTRRGRDVVRISVDDFHRPRAKRHARGRESPEGFWRDSFDLCLLAAYVLDPFGPGGSRWYRPRGHDLRSDRRLEPPERMAPPGAVVIVDGLFLHRRELRARWQFSIWLDVPFHVTAARMARRDGSPPDPDHPAMRRYVEGQRLYLTDSKPQERADMVVDNTSWSRPRVIR